MSGRIRVRPAPDAAITHTAAAKIVRDYATRNVRAIAAAMNPPYKGAAWSAVDSGPILAADAYDTKAALLKKSKPPKPMTSLEAPNVLGATASVFVKGASAWRLDAAMGGVRLSTLPEEPKTTPSLTAVQRQTAANAVPVVVNAVATGTMSHVANPAPLKTFPPKH